MVKYLESDAVISDCGKYRYLLRRTWDFDKPRMLVIMLNPSTADAKQDDATIRSLVRICKALHYGSFEVVNVFAFRATKPNELEEQDAPTGPRNRAIIEAAVGRCDMIVCAWGSHPMGSYPGEQMRQELRNRRPAIFCFGTTKDGFPKHPLYLKTDTQLQKFGF